MRSNDYERSSIGVLSRGLNVVAMGIGYAVLGYAAWLLLRKEQQLSPGPMTPATGKIHAADAPIGAPGRNIEDRLDEALQESFPTSDPVSIQIG